MDGNERVTDGHTGLLHPGPVHELPFHLNVRLRFHICIKADCHINRGTDKRQFDWTLLDLKTLRLHF